MSARHRLVTTTELATEIGLSERTIQRYRADGYLTPAIETRGGHARWDVTAVIEQLRAVPRTSNDD